MMKKLTKLSIEDVITHVTNVFSDVKVTFKNETFLSPTEDEEFPPSDEEVPDPYELINDETENQTYDSQLTFPRDKTGDVIKFLKEKLGEPTEMRGGKDKEKTDPVWKYGRKGSGQLWIYPVSDDRSVVDVRYYYDKV